MLSQRTSIRMLFVISLVGKDKLESWEWITGSGFRMFHRYIKIVHKNFIPTKLLMFNIYVF